MKRAARRILSAAALILVPLSLAGAPAAHAQEDLRLPGGPTSATDTSPVDLDASIYLPDASPAPAVVLAHGFGGSKADLDERARQLSESGFVVVAYSARGFGTSTGQISMDSPDYEVADARAVIDYLGTRGDVVQDGSGDPRVGIAGGSYGGALALLAAGYDPRVDAVVSDITWNDLESSLFGQAAQTDPATRGVFKSLWTGAFFGSGAVSRDGEVTVCGRFTEEWCRAYTDAAAEGVVTPASAELMRASSPGSVADAITAPTLLMAGEADSLFPLSQSSATAQQIAQAHPQTPLKVVWHGGGHDGGIDESERLDALGTAWLEQYLKGEGTVSTDFVVTSASASISTASAGTAPVVLQAPAFPGIEGGSTVDVALAGPSQRVLAPPGGLPAAITTAPGLGGALAGLVQRSLPGQTASFDSSPLLSPLTIIGAGAVRLRVAAPEATTPADAVLFASLRIVSANGRETVPNGLVAPIRISGLGRVARELTIQLPAVVATAATGDRLRVTLATTDAAYRLPMQPQLYDISLAAPALSVPQVDARPVSGGTAPYWWLIGAAVIVLLIALVLVRLRPRHGTASGSADAPLVITSLSKRYGDGYLAVDDLSFTVEPGMVLGLLGPNGAGKTTTMRMVMGLIRPSAGHITAFGEAVYAGAPVLARIGALVEGAGFLPHLTGRQNLDLYWRASGRTHDPSHLDEVLATADLGSAIDKRVRSYSQGMRQRLGIAQAMLGRPDLLMLDEPTNGLDPPQIKEMRDVLHRYAEEGRTVIISSHLLSEVEQTCTHVVVMHRGRLMAAGRVSDLLAGRTGQHLEDVFLEIVGDDLTVGLS